MKLSEIRKGLQCENREGVLKGMNRDAVEILSSLGLFQNTDISPMRTIDNILSQKGAVMCGDDWGTLPYNTYPFGTPGTLQPRLLTICRGKEKLGHFLEEVLAKSWKMQRKYPHEEKTVIILTDKWDNATFKKHEKIFLKYAVQNEIRYIILLITDYGITEIPFLPKNPATLRAIQFEDIENDEVVDDMTRLLDGRPIEFSITEYAPQNDEMVNFKFYLEDMRWVRTDKQGIAEGNIQPDYLQQFIEDIKWITDMRKKVVAPKSKTVDAPICRLKIAEKTAEWVRGAMYTEDDRRFSELEHSVWGFIGTFEK